jgi:tight adherence protein B
VSAATLAAAAVVAALLLLPRRDAAARRRLRGRAGPRARRRSAGGPRTPDAAPPGSTDVAALAERLAGVALAGLPPSRVWAVLAARPGPHAGIARAVLPWLDAGASPGRALRAVAARPGLAAPERVRLACLATALDACDRAGAPLGPALDGLAAALRAEEEARRDRETALAAPRATAAVMTALPAVGLVLAVALGVDVAGVLTGTAPGRVALVLGCAFWLAGRRWTARLVARAAL